MSKIPSSLLNVQTLLLHVIGIPVFFLGFILLYDSLWIDRFLDTGLGAVFNALMLTCILIGVLCASRIPVTCLRTKFHFNWWQYILWSLAEIIVFACFAALYMALVYGSVGYFAALGKCLVVCFAILPYPYLLFALLTAFVRPDDITVQEDELVRFTDSTGRLKLVIASNVILYIEARENYVDVHYLEGTVLKKYSLRMSMRGLEPLLQKHGIIRCQRSFYVNPKHVKVLRRDKEGIIQAELDAGNTRTVPVSPKFYEQLSQML